MGKRQILNRLNGLSKRIAEDLKSYQKELKDIMSDDDSLSYPDKVDDLYKIIYPSTDLVEFSNRSFLYKCITHKDNIEYGEINALTINDAINKLKNKYAKVLTCI